MFDKQFVKDQRKLYYRLQDQMALRRIITGGLLVLFGLTSAVYDTSPDSTVGATASTALWTLIILSIFSHYWFRARRNNLQNRLWQKANPNAAGKKTNPFDDQIRSPLLTYNTSLVTDTVLYRSGYRGLALTIHKLKSYYSLSRRFSPGPLNKYGLEYLVLQVRLDNIYPHIFVDGLAQNFFSFKNTNLWSLPRKLEHKQKMQKLEGDFPKFFNVYMAPNKLANLQIDALSILMPDIMLALRDDGYNFDYEIYENKLLIICEPDMYTADDIEAFFKAVDAVLDQLIPQLEKFKISQKSFELKLSHSRLTFNALSNTVKVMAYYTLFVGTPIVLGYLLGALSVA